MATDDRQFSVPISLHQSAALDTDNHSLLIKRMKSEFGVTGMPLDWLRSYLGDREQFVKTGRISQTQFSLTSAFHKGRYLAHCCSSYTAVQWLTSSRSMASSTTSRPTPTIRSWVYRCQLTTPPRGSPFLPRVYTSDDKQWYYYYYYYTEFSVPYVSHK